MFKDGHLYGMFSFKKYGDGPLKCVDIATGEIKWEQEGFGAGNVIRVGDNILALTDYGKLVLVAGSPAGYKQLADSEGVAGKMLEHAGAGRWPHLCAKHERGRCL